MFLTDSCSIGHVKEVNYLIKEEPVWDFNDCLCQKAWPFYIDLVSFFRYKTGKLFATYFERK